MRRHHRAVVVAVDVPASARELLDRVDYCDAHTARAPSRRTARETVERALASSPRLAVLARWAHRGLLLHVARADAEHPVGWSIRSDTADRVVLATHGPLFTARIQVDVTADAVVTLSTVVRYEQPVSGVVWSGIAPLHRLVLRRLIAAGAA